MTTSDKPLRKQRPSHVAYTFCENPPFSFSRRKVTNAVTVRGTWEA